MDRSSEHLRSNAVGVAAFLVVMLLATLAFAARAEAFVYWTNGADGTIGRATPQGASIDQNFITGANSDSGLAVDVSHIYWADYATQMLGRADLDGLNANPSFIGTGRSPEGVAVDAAHIYWANFADDTIGRADLDGSNPDQNFIPAATGIDPAGAADPAGVAVDAGHIYWTNFNSNTIGRADLNGANPNPSFIALSGRSEGLAVADSHIYWTNINEGAIGRADLNGSNVNQRFITVAGGPASLTGIAISPTYIYWGNYSNNAIGRADLDGSNVNPSFITGVSGPKGVAVDPDTSPPQTTINEGPAEGSFTNDSTPTFSLASSESGSTFECKLDGGSYAACSSPHITQGLADGPHTFAVRATDPAGNTDPTPASRSFTVDTTVPTPPPDGIAPQTTITKHPKRKLVINKAKVKVKFTFGANENSSFQCKLDKKAWKTCSSPKSYKVNAGKHKFKVQATDLAGNMDETPAVWRWNVKQR